MCHMHHPPVRNVMKKTVKRKKKKKALNVVITVLLGLLSPPCFLLPTAQTSSQCCHSEASPLLHREVAEMQDFFPLKVGFSLSEETAPQHRAWKISGFCTP